MVSLGREREREEEGERGGAVNVDAIYRIEYSAEVGVGRRASVVPLLKRKNRGTG